MIPAGLLRGPLSLAVLLPLALTAAGCYSLSDVPSSHCPGGRASPITTAQAVAALRQHGFSAREKPESCAGSARTAMVIGNSIDGYDEDDPSEDEGHVVCHIDRVTTGKAVRIPGVWETAGTDRDDANLILKNINCSLYSRRDRQDETRRLRAAMESLRSELNG